MAKPVIVKIVFAMLGFAAIQAGGAEMLPDPTRPPAGAGFSESGANPVVDAGPVLQSVKIAPGRRMAVISGQLLVEGDSLGAARLEHIGASEVILLGPEGRQTLKLFPDVEKKMAKTLQFQPQTPGENKSKRKIEQKAP